MRTWECMYNIELHWYYQPNYCLITGDNYFTFRGCQAKL